MNDCKILVVDDNLDHAAIIAREIMMVDTERIKSAPLRVEITNSAHFAAKCLVADKCRWDILISDVFMPRQSGENSGICKHEEYQEFEAWVWAGRAGEADFDNGGMVIARQIAALQLANPPKLLLVSAMLENGPHRKTIHDLEHAHPTWFRYWDKARWSDSDPTGGLRPNIFRFALVQAIRNHQSEDWGVRPDFVVDAPIMQEVELTAREIAAQPDIKQMLIVGPPGVGKNCVAQLIHRWRDSSGELKLFDCQSHPGQIFDHLEEEMRHPSAALNTLFFYRLEDLDQRAQGDIFKFLRADMPAAGANSPLILWVAENRSRLQEPATFRPDLWNLLKGLQAVNIPSLSDRPGEIRIISERYLKQKRPGVTVDAAVWPILEAYDWPCNVQQLIKVLDRALVGSPRILTCRDLDIEQRTSKDAEVDSSQILKRYHTVGRHIHELRRSIAGDEFSLDDAMKDPLLNEFKRPLLEKLFRGIKLKQKSRELTAQLLSGVSFKTLVTKCGAKPKSLNRS